MASEKKALDDAALTAIRKLIPSNLPPEVAEEIVQDVCILILEGQIDLDRLQEGIREHLPSLRKRYPSLQFQISLDAPVREDSTATLADFIHKQGTLRKTRKRIGRPRTRVVVKAKCEACGEQFYFKNKHRKLSKKERERARFLPEIDPKYWSDHDCELIEITNPRLVDTKRTRHRNGRFCSRACIMVFYRNLRRKLPDREELVRLYSVEMRSTCWIATRFGARPNAVRSALLAYGVEMRTKNHGTSKCIEPGCVKPAFKVRHAGNGSMYGTRCKFHRALHYATLNRNLARKNQNIPESRWRYKREVPA